MMRHPVDNPVFGSGFGPRKAPTPGASTKHLAQDYPKAANTPVRAIADGVIERVFWADAGGWWIHVRRPNGDLYGGCHLRAKPTLPVGTKVEEGDVIGYVGSTGYATTGPHLHFIVLVDGAPVDPRKYIGDSSLSHPTTPTTPTTPAPAPEEEDDDMKDLLLGVKLADNRLIVQNLADHTYYEVGSTSQWNYLKALGLKLVSGPQAVSVIAGFKKI